MTTRRFPNILSDLEQAGYAFRGHALCSGCHKSVEYWSPPGAAPIAYDLMALPSSPIVPHRCGTRKYATEASLKRQRRTGEWSHVA